MDGESLDSLPAASSITKTQDDGTLKVIELDMVDYEDQQMDLIPGGNIPSSRGNNLNPDTETGGPSAEEAGGTTLATSPDVPTSDDGGCTHGNSTGTWPLFIGLLGLFIVARRHGSTFEN